MTISAPRMAIRSAMPWPVRWLVAGVMLGLSGAVALWAFEFGKTVAGIDLGTHEEVVALRTEVAQLRQSVAQAQALSSAAESIAATERAAQEALLAQMRQLENDNLNLRNDLAFFERLIPAGASERVSVRGLQGERLGESQLKWQALLIQAQRNVQEFEGVLEIGLTGTLNGEPWGQNVAARQPVAFKQYLRLEGLLDLPPQAVVKTITAKVVQGNRVKTVQVLKLG
jgi:hypothetical protein